MAKIEQFTSRASALAEDDSQDGFYRPAAASKLRSELRADALPGPLPRYRADDADEAAGEDAFLRSRRRVPVRKSRLPRTRIGQAALGAGALAGLAAISLAGIAASNLLKHDPRFRIDSSDSIQILGNSQVTRPELLSVFGSDIGRNVFFIPLAERRAALESLPWVEHATVMRLLPNQMRVAIVERTPIAFVRTGNEIALVDGGGVILPMPKAGTSAGTGENRAANRNTNYSFPVVTGIDESDPLSTRSARMHIYQRFVKDLDAGGENISSQLSEVDLSDPEDIKAILPSTGPDVGTDAGAAQHDMLLHFGDQDFLARFHNYQAHLSEWRQQYPHLASIDLRYERQVVLEMDKSAAAGPASASTSGLTAAPTAASPGSGAPPSPAPEVKPKASAHGISKAGRKTAKKAGPLSKAAANHAPFFKSKPYAESRPVAPVTEAAQ